MNEDILEECIDDLEEEKENLQKKYDSLQQRIDKANELLSEILVISDWEHKGRFRPVKNTTRQDVYETIIKLNELFETPYRHNYNLLQGSDTNE